MVTVIFELPSGYGDLYPAELDQTLFRGGARLSDNLSAVTIAASREAMADQLAGYRLRYALSAAEVWEQMPELRRHFLFEIERCEFAGWTTYWMEAGQAAPGDRLKSNAVRFDPGASGFEDEAEFCFNAAFDDATIAEAIPVLSERPSSELGPDLSTATIIFVRGFAIRNLARRAVAPGIEILNPVELFELTDLRERYSAVLSKRHPLLPPPPSLPAGSSCAFVGSGNTSPDFLKAVVERLFAAGAFIDDGLEPQIVRVLTFQPGGYAYEGEQMTAGLPFKRPHAPTATTIDASTPFARSILALTAVCTAVGFSSGKDDFRLMALDTIADSQRGRSPYIRFAQLWMAVERLLSVQSETTVGLSICRAAFVAAPERASSFARTKKLYDLRSRIVHGYKFDRTLDLHSAQMEIAEWLRQLMIWAVTTKETDLYPALTNHVLSGAPAPIDAITFAS